MVKEGILFVVIPFVIGVFFLLLKIPVFSYIFAIIMYILVICFAFFFRDPHRIITARQNEIMSPVDGAVLEVVDEGDSNRIVIFLSILNVHVTRFPFSGTLENMEYLEGKFFPAYKKEASDLNERVTLTVHSQQIKYVLKLIAGVAARRIKMWVKQGDTLNTGDKIGIIMFGSRAELIFPKSVELLIKKDDKVKGGLTLLGKIKNPK